MEDQHTDSSMPAGEISRVPYATDERDPETLQRISEPCPKCGSSGRVAEGQGVYWTCGKWYPSVSRPGGEPMTATRGNCDEVAALRAEWQEAVVLMECGVEFIGRCAIDHDDLAAFDVEAKMLKMLGREATHA